MEQIKQPQHYEEEFSFSKKPNIFMFLISPVKQFQRLKIEPIVLGPMFLILGIVLLGLIFPAFIGQGGLIDLNGMSGSYNEQEMYAGEDMAYYEGETPLGNFNIEQLVSGLIVGIVVLVIFAAAPPLLALLFMAFAKMQNNRTSFGTLYSMTVFSTLSIAVGFLYLMIMNAINGTFGYTYTAPSVFVTQENIFYPLLSTLEVSTMVFIVLIVVGLIKAANFSRFTASAVGGGLFALVFVMNLLGGLYS